MAIGKLAFASFRTLKVRVALTVAAVALSVSLVVAVTSGYHSMEVAVFRYLAQYLGSTDVQVVRTGDVHGAMDEAIVEQLKADPMVARVVGRFETTTRLLDARGEPTQGRAFLLGVQLPEDADVAALGMAEGKFGRWFAGDEGNVAVVDQEAAKRMDARMGGTITLPGINRKLTLTVVGIVHKPGILAEHIQTIYVPLRTLQQYAQLPGKVNRIDVVLKSGVDPQAFARVWEPRLQQRDPKIKLRFTADRKHEMDRNLRAVRLLSYLGGTISMLAATFIVFSTLSMGVAERSRVLAMLRAVGATKRQIAGTVVLEAIALAGVGAAIGAPLGWLWVKMLAWYFPDYFPTGAQLSVGGVAFGATASIAAAVIASLLPAWNATRVSPLEGLTPLGRTTSWRGMITSALAAVPLVLVDPILMFAPQVPRGIALWAHYGVGLPCLMLGFFLLSPMFVYVTERALAGPVAWLMRVRAPLLRQQLSGSAWRAAGTASALMVGLSVLVVLQTQGNTVLNGWRLPDKFPDMFVAATTTMLGTGLDEAQIRQLQSLPDIKRDARGRAQVLPIAIDIAGLVAGTLDADGTGIVPDKTMFLGVDPDLALEMMELEFRTPDGKPAPPAERERLARQAVEMLKLGRHIIVTDEFRQLKGLKIGDQYPLKTPRHGEVQYTVAGVVWSPGIDVMVQMYDLKQMFEERSAGSVFGSLEDARRDFGVERINLFAINLDYRGATKKEVEERIRKTLGLWGLVAGDVREIKNKIVAGFRRLLNLISTVALAAIAVASLGVTNTIMASIRTRRWQLGILRSVGVTRSQLLRTILAEALLLGLVGCVLGVAAGLEMAVNANGLTTKVFGYGPPIDVPWPVVLAGVGIIMLVALVASLWPATSAARQEPLALLQSGRAAA
jgi:putative ABC transport system permease protein